LYYRTAKIRKDETLQIIDTHAHLDMPEFEADRDEVIARSRDLGVTTIITIGIDLDSSRKAIELAEKYPGVLAAVGVHPQESRGVRQEDIDNLESLARHPRVAAVGELGLDFYRHHSAAEEQVPVLHWELEMAKRVGLPIIIHCRQAQREMLDILRDWSASYTLPKGKPRGVLHCFGGDITTAERYMEMGFFISIGAYVGYPSSAPLRSTLQNIPQDRLVVETDCPFLPPQKYRGQRNEPSYTLMTLGVLAEIKRISLEEMADQTRRNAIRLFNLTRIDPASFGS
jgi:TatD DNase family protein